MNPPNENEGQSGEVCPKCGARKYRERQEHGKTKPYIDYGCGSVYWRNECVFQHHACTAIECDALKAEVEELKAYIIGCSDLITDQRTGVLAGRIQNLKDERDTLRAELESVTREVSECRIQLWATDEESLVDAVGRSEEEFRNICILCGFDPSDGEGTSHAEVTQAVAGKIAELTQSRARCAELEADKRRMDDLEGLIRHCPHTKFDFSDDPDEESPQGFSITIAGCEVIQHVGDTFREVVDKDIAYGDAEAALPSEQKEGV